MKLSFFRKSVHYIPAQQREGSLQDIRERIISILIGSAITLGGLAFVAAVFPALRTRQYWAIGAYAVCYIWILIVGLQRHNFPYVVKVYSLSFIFYVLGVINLVQNGLSSDAGVFLLSFTVVISLMVGARSGVYALILSVSTYALVGFLMSSGSLIPPILTDYREAIDWVSGGVVLVLLSTILLLSSNTILRGLNDSITNTRILAVDIDRDREQIRLRSKDLERRLSQLRAAAEIEHTISAILDPEDLMQKVVGLLGERFELYHVGIFLLSENALSLKQGGLDGELQRGMDTASYAKFGIEVVYRAGIGNIIPEGYKLSLTGSSNAGWVMVNHKPRAVQTGGKNKDEFTTTYLPLAHTELALPLLSHERVIGVLMTYSTQTNAFDAEDIALFQSVADSFAIALENTRLFKQNQDDLEEIRILQKQYLSNAWAETEKAHGHLSYTYEAGIRQRVSPQQGEQDNAKKTNSITYRTPISLRDQIIGQFSLEAEKPGWSDEDRAFIESVITEAALALENARLLTETRQRANHDRLIADITRTVQASSDIETILSSAIRELGRNLRVSEAIISLNTVAEGDDKNQTGRLGENVNPYNDGRKDTGKGNPSLETDVGLAQQEVNP
jgi:GAF domain-containing protein